MNYFYNYFRLYNNNTIYQSYSLYTRGSMLDFARSYKRHKKKK